MKRLIFAFIVIFLLFTHIVFAQVYKSPSTVVVNTSQAIVFHATDCTGVTAVEGVVCYEEDSNRVFVCEPTAGDCDTAGEWAQISYCNLTGCTLTGPLVLDDTSLQIQEGADTLTITVPALTAARAVTFGNLAGEVVLDTATQTLTGKTMAAADNVLHADDAVAAVADGANCAANSCAGGVDTAWAAQSCVAPLLLSGGTLTGALVTAKVSYAPQSLTIDDNVVPATPATDSATTLTKSYLKVTCSDGDGCELTLSETSAVDGQQLQVTNIDTNNVVMIDSDGVADMCGDTNDTLLTGQVATYIYITNHWLEITGPGC